MNFFFDVGSTIMAGPARSPRAQLHSLLSDHNSELADLGHLVYGTRIESAHDLVLAISYMDRDVITDQHCMRSISRIWYDQYQLAHMIDGMSHVLRFIHQSARWHVISNIWKPFWDRCRDEFLLCGVSPQTATLSYMTGWVKPDPKIYLCALDQAGCTASDSIMIGDSWEKDIRPALAVGMRAIHIGGPTDGLAADGVHCVRDAYELLGLLKILVETGEFG